MIFIIIFLVPLFRDAGGITIYQYLEKRYGPETRSVMSLIFLLSRSLATGVALLATSYVTSECIKIPLVPTIIIIGAISLFYTALGGIKADIYSDILQLGILWASSIVVIFILYNLLDGNVEFNNVQTDRFKVFDMTSAGIGDNNTFSFWPMLFGGLFLYISYYGCDQSQAQRLLATETNRGAQKSLLINGLMRFPLVVTYSAVGFLLIFFLDKNPSFLAKVSSRPPDYIMPAFFYEYLPPGILGLTVAGIFAASMSSLDSAINSLSAATWQDFLIKLFPSIDRIPDKEKVRASRAITVFWGVFSTLCAVYMAGGAETVVELVNKIGSAFYGPIAGVFMLGILVKRSGQTAALTGLVSGVLVNIILWLKFELIVSWMWWNLAGFIITIFVGGCISIFFREQVKIDNIEPYFSIKSLFCGFPKLYVAALLVWFCLIISLSLVLHSSIID